MLVGRQAHISLQTQNTTCEVRISPITQTCWEHISLKTQILTCQVNISPSNSTCQANISPQNKNLQTAPKVGSSCESIQSQKPP